VNVLTLEPENRSFTWTTADQELNLLYADTGEAARLEYQLINGELNLAGIDGDGIGLQLLVKDSQTRDPRLVGDWFMTDTFQTQEDTHAAWGGETIYAADGTVSFTYQYEWTPDQPTYRTISATWSTSGDYVLYYSAAQPGLAEAHPYRISLDGTMVTAEIPEIDGINKIVAYKSLGEHDPSLVGQWTQVGHTLDGAALTFEPVTWTFNADTTGARDYRSTTDDTLSWETNTGARLFIQKQDPTVLGYGYSVGHSIAGNSLTMSCADVSQATPVDIVDTYERQD
jgi:hypothetical protein